MTTQESRLYVYTITFENKRTVTVEADSHEEISHRHFGVIGIQLMRDGEKIGNYNPIIGWNRHPHQPTNQSPARKGMPQV